MNNVIRDLGVWDFDKLTVEDLVVGGRLTVDGEVFVDELRAIIAELDDHVNMAELLGI